MTQKARIWTHLCPKGTKSLLESKSTASQPAVALIIVKHASPVAPPSTGVPPEICMPGYACQPDGSAASRQRTWSHCYFMEHAVHTRETLRRLCFRAFRMFPIKSHMLEGDLLDGPTKVTGVKPVVGAGNAVGTTVTGAIVVAVPDGARVGS